MTELELYKFVQDKEMDWRGADYTHLYLWIPFYALEEFTKLLGYDYLCEDGEEVSLQYNCVCVDLLDICENFEIDPTNILPKANNS
jgi:hypothetical protein